MRIPSSTKSQTRPPAAADPAARGRDLLATHFEKIERQLRALGRRSGLPDHEADELVSWALFKLVDNDYRILAQWQGRSSFSTFLTVVLVNLTRDYRIHVWGKWRPSAAARIGYPSSGRTRRRISQ
jgi:DNA-directed RNA polymerase specialized sigma24 family protein